MTLPDRDLEAATLRKRLTIASYRPADRHARECECCPGDECRCCDVMERVTPAEERRDEAEQ
jgi:hypothetical protein